jgi:hypothetical protein
MAQSKHLRLKGFFLVVPTSLLMLVSNFTSLLVVNPALGVNTSVRNPKSKEVRDRRVSVNDKVIKNSILDKSVITLAQSQCEAEVKPTVSFQQELQPAERFDNEEIKAAETVRLYYFRKAKSITELLKNL